MPRPSNIADKHYFAILDAATTSVNRPVDVARAVGRSAQATRTMMDRLVRAGYLDKPGYRLTEKGALALQHGGSLVFASQNMPSQVRARTERAARQKAILSVLRSTDPGRIGLTRRQIERVLQTAQGRRPKAYKMQDALRDLVQRNVLTYDPSDHTYTLVESP